MIPRPRVPPNAHQMMPQRPPFGPYSQPNHPPNMRLPMNTSMPPRAHAQPMNPTIPTQTLPLPLINAPRKVLINPNFKGGVQAATSKYIFLVLIIDFFFSIKQCALLSYSMQCTRCIIDENMHLQTHS